MSQSLSLYDDEHCITNVINYWYDPMWLAGLKAPTN